jgi:steroid 5-alpha reductase family enzyme
MAALITLWGGRLTYNFARKGGYRRGGEDYRWAVIRDKLGPLGWQVFNFLFVAVFQHALLLALTMPCLVALDQEPAPLRMPDVVLAVAFGLFFAGEAIADQQQWNFQTSKIQRVARGEPIIHPFLTTGLFRYSRHPNFFCELGMWWTVYLFSVSAGAAWINPSIGGALGLTAVILGSTNLTESISLSKYPAYADYQRRTSMLVPWFPRARTSGEGRGHPS